MYELKANRKGSPVLITHHAIRTYAALHAFLALALKEVSGQIHATAASLSVNEFAVCIEQEDRRHPEIMWTPL